MQMMLTTLAENMPRYNVHQLSHILYCTVKLRLPEDRLINSSIELITAKLSKFEAEDEQMDMKDLALVIWACARIKMPKDSELPNKLKVRADNALKDCVMNQFLFDWKLQDPKGSDFDSLHNALDSDMRGVLGSDALHDQHTEHAFSKVTHV